MRKFIKATFLIVGFLWLIGTLPEEEGAALVENVSQLNNQTKTNVSALPSSPPLPETEVERVDRILAIKDIYVTGSVVNVRAIPSASGEKLGSFPRGTKLGFSGLESGPWRQILFGNGRFGWMHGDYLSLVALPKENPKPQTERATITYKRSEVAQAIINNSIRSYSGSCPCPYNTDRAGRRCGGRSAWSKPGGASPVCYVGDVTQSRIESWVARQRGATLVR